MRLRLLVPLLVLAGCGAGDRTQVMLAGTPVDPRAVTAADVQREVQVVPRGDRISFQAPPIETIRDIDLREAGKEMGLKLGTVQRIRFGYLFGVLDRPSGELRHYLLFQSNFIEGHDRYVNVALRDGTPLPFTVSRVPDPCVPNCFPVIEALVVDMPDAVLRVQATSGFELDVTLDTAQVIRLAGSGAYVSGYLAAIDAERAR